MNRDTLHKRQTDTENEPFLTQEAPKATKKTRPILKGDGEVVAWGSSLCLVILLLVICCFFSADSTAFYYTLRIGALVVIAIFIHQTQWQPKSVRRQDFAAFEASYECPLGPPVAANPIVAMDILIGLEFVGTIEIELKADTAPKTVENFINYCGKGPGGYRGLWFHRVVQNFMCQTGLVRSQEGGSSIREIPEWDDENFILKHTERGIISMANKGPNTNTSQFFIAMKPLPHLDGKHVVFAQVLRGFDVVKAIESVGSSWNPLGFTSQMVHISRCEVLETPV